MKKKTLKFEYPFVIRPLSSNDGGGFLIEFLDLPGCMSDGKTIEEAIANGQDAINCWISAAQKSGRAVPKANSLKEQSGKWLQRVPKSLHAKLTYQAEYEGVSLNTLVISILAEALGQRLKFNKKGSVSN